MATLYAPKSAQTELVLLLLGEKESGKSSVGNTVLCRQAFHIKTTRTCKKSSSIYGPQVAVVDTPGWLSHLTTPNRVSRELVRSLTLCQPGPHAILLVLPTFRTFDQEQWKAMEAQLRLLQTPIWQKAIVLFTHGDKLGLPIQEHIRQQGGTLRWLLERCGNRYQIMTNHSSTSWFQVQELFEKIQNMTEAPKWLREVQYSVRLQLGEDGTVSVEQKWDTKEQKMEMAVMNDVQDGILGQMEIVSGCSHITRGFPKGPAGLKPPLSLILLGRRKSGKSSVGNRILGREEFQRDTKTTKCSEGHADVSGWPVTVVDTPGWSLFGLANPEMVKKEIVQSPSFCPVGNKVMFLLAIPVDSFEEKDRKAVETYVSVLGEMIWRYITVLFTYGEVLRGRSIECYIKETGKPLLWVLERCDHRFYVFDANISHQTQVNQLLEMV